MEIYMVHRLFMHTVMAWYQSMRVCSLSSQTLSHVPSRKVRGSLADVISIHSLQLATPGVAAVSKWNSMI